MRVVRKSDDEIQMASLKQWKADKEKRHREKIEKRSIRNMHIRFMGLYIRAAVGRLIMWLKG